MDYSKAPAAGTPTWLKLSREDAEKDAAQKDVAGLEKENAKPASTERMARKAAALQKIDLANLEQQKGKGRPPLARKDEGDDVTAKVRAEKKGKASKSAAPPTDANVNTSKEVKDKGKKVASATEEQAAEGAHNSEPKQRSKARKSAPAPMPAPRA